jgi:hypothetical protein
MVVMMPILGQGLFFDSPPKAMLYSVWLWARSLVSLTSKNRRRGQADGDLDHL